MARYKLDIARDVDPDGSDGYMLCLPYGFRFYDDLVHVRGYDTLAEVRAAAKSDVVPCDCTECKTKLSKGA
jgi:hypothetical protein